MSTSYEDKLIEMVEEIDRKMYDKYNIDITDPSIKISDSNSVCSDHSQCDFVPIGNMEKNPYAEYSCHVMCPEGHKISCTQRQMYEENEYYSQNHAILCDKCNKKHVYDHIESMLVLIKNTQERLKKNKKLIKEADDINLLMMINNIKCYNYLDKMHNYSKTNSADINYSLMNIRENTLKKSRDVCIHNIEYYLNNTIIQTHMYPNTIAKKISKYQTLLNTSIIDLV
jgi:hypothetical protein